MILLLELLLGTALCGALAWGFYRCDAENIGTWQKLCRNRIIGIALALPCTLLCVPLALPVSPGFLVLWLYPLAVALPVLSYFYIDYYASRSLAFFWILLAYDVVHGAFELHLPGASFITIIALLWGIAGIWISAKPCTLRDVFRKSAVSKKWKYSVASVMAVAGAVMLYTLTVSIWSMCR